MWLHWARGVFVEVLEKDDYVLSCYRANEEVMQTLLAQGKENGEAGRRAGWAVLWTGEMFARRNEDEHPDWRHYRTALEGQR